MTRITTHVLDTARGVPAAGVAVRLDAEVDGHWQRVGAAATDDDGRCSDLRGGNAPGATRFRLRFSVAEYQEAHGIEAFFPVVDVAFEVAPEREHLHVPLLLSPYGYSTYRGS